MSFCTQCGAMHVEGEVHQCPNKSTFPQQVLTTNQTAAASSTAPIVTPSWGEVSIHQISSLIKNPFSSVQLSVETGFRYGVLGFIACALGIFLWFSGVYNNLTSDVINLFGIGKALGLPSGLNIDYILQLNYVKDLFVVILMMAIYLVAIYLISNGMGNCKKDFKLAISVLGSTQWTASIGFIVAAIISYVSIPLSIIIFFIFVASNAMIVLLVSLEFFTIATSKKVGFVVLSITTSLIIPGLILRYFFNSELVSMINIAFKTNYFSFSDISSQMMKYILRGL